LGAGELVAGQWQPQERGVHAHELAALGELDVAELPEPDPLCALNVEN